MRIGHGRREPVAAKSYKPVSSASTWSMSVASRSLGVPRRRPALHRWGQTTCRGTLDREVGPATTSTPSPGRHLGHHLAPSLPKTSTTKTLGRTGPPAASTPTQEEQPRQATPSPRLLSSPPPSSPKTQRSWLGATSLQTSPANAGRETDFYRIEDPSLDPTVVPSLFFQHLLVEILSQP